MTDFLKKLKIFYLIAVLVLLIFAAGILSPIIINNVADNWNENLREKIDQLETSVKEKFREKENELLAVKNTLKDEIRNLLPEDSLGLRLIFNVLSSEKYDLYSIELLDDSLNLIAWTKNSRTATVINSNYNLNEIYFHSFPLVSYLAVTDSITTKTKRYFIYTALPVEKHYYFAGNYYRQLSIQSEITDEISTLARISFDPYAQRSNDGREYSFDLLNNFNNKIGIVTIEKPSRDSELQSIRSTITNIQKITASVILIIILIFLYLKLDREKRLFRLLILSAYIIALRLLFYFLEVPSSLVTGALTNPSYFSSVFGGGIVKSPLELFITLFLLLLIVLEFFKLIVHFYGRNTEKEKSFLKFAFVTVLSYALILLSLRGLGASIRSIIFDSTLRYFKEYTLFPDLPTAFMQINLLILGFIVICFSTSLLIFSIVNFPFRDLNPGDKIPRFRKPVVAALHLNLKVPFSQGESAYLREVLIPLWRGVWIWTFLFFQIGGWLYDELQIQPQGTPFVRITFLTIIFVLAYIFIKKNLSIVIHYLFYALAASIITVSLLNHYNSELERESLKVAAEDVTRRNENFLNFMLYQTLAAAQSNYELGKKLSQNSNLSAEGFIIWSESMLYREGIPCYIDFYDENGRYINGFSLNNNQKHDEVLQKFYMTAKPVIFKEKSIYNNDIIYKGITSIFAGEQILGYLMIKVNFNPDFVASNEIPKFLEFSRVGLSSAIDVNKLKIFIFQRDVLVYSFGDITLNNKEKRSILNAQFNNFNEAWLSTTINGEKNLVYNLRDNRNGVERIIAVALGERNFSSNLFDFFKVFFFHAIIIAALLIIFSLARYKTTIKILFSFRIRLVSAFLVISILPMIFMAVYFRNFTEGKNSELIMNKLDERSQLVEKYLNKYLLNTDLNEYTILQKAKDDLGINFSVYKGENLVFSTEENFYNIGLFSRYLNPTAFSTLQIEGIKEYLTLNKIENYSYHSLFYKAQIAGKDFVLEINDLFNTLLIPLSDVEIDVVMFGSYSLAVIIIFIISTILANQISAPVRKLTSATKSVASGDLNVEVKEAHRGEIKDLVEGFNQMVNDLRINQIQLARLERENAWREMAKQVAHEIKNPLTPMKLSIQQLITAVKDKSPKLEEVFDKVTATIISQIETLRNIASEFSNFARMPNLKIENVDVVKAAGEAVNLFSDEKTKVTLHTSVRHLMIAADFDQLKRTLINLIRNSIQANSTLVDVYITSNDNECEIRVKDNGSGIPEENRNKIFENNFTTKEKGMGIGLTLAKRFVDGLNGTISLESTSARGTTFLIKIPLKQTV